MTTTEQTYGISAALDVPFEEAIERATAALKEQGFGVLTTIDVQATLKQKIDVDFERYTILGACNPHLAYRGLQASHDLGLLLPCNVIVHEHEGKSVVSAVDPRAMLAAAGDTSELRAVAAEAEERLRTAIDSLREG